MPQTSPKWAQVGGNLLARIEQASRRLKCDNCEPIRLEIGIREATLLATYFGAMFSYQKPVEDYEILPGIYEERPSDDDSPLYPSQVKGLTVETTEQPRCRVVARQRDPGAHLTLYRSIDVDY